MLTARSIMTPEGAMLSSGSPAENAGYRLPQEAITDGRGERRTPATGLPSYGHRAPWLPRGFAS